MSNSNQKIWSEHEVDILKKEYPTCSSLRELADIMERSVYSLIGKANSLGIRRKIIAVWTPDMDNVLKENYPYKETSEVAKMLGLTTKQILCRARRLKLHKSPEVFKGIRENGMFLKGHVPFNKGKKQHEFMSEEVIQKTIATRFKKGQIPVNIKNVGYERVNVDGYVEIKTEKGFVLKHRMLWEKYYGKIPKRHVIRFKNGNKQDVRIENLELVTFENNMKDNTIHNYPPEIKTAIRSIANIKRRIKKYEQTNNRQTE